MSVHDFMTDASFVSVEEYSNTDKNTLYQSLVGLDIHVGLIHVCDWVGLCLSSVSLDFRTFLMMS